MFEANEINHKELLVEISNIFEKSNNNSELLNAFIESGKKIFKLETGIISKIENGQYTVLAVSSPLEFKVGDVYPLADTYCTLVNQERTHVSIQDVSDDPRLNAHPVYVNLQLRSYLAFPIWVTDEKGSHLFGTFNFTSKENRHEPYLNEQIEYGLLLSNILSKLFTNFN